MEKQFEGGEKNKKNITIEEKEQLEKTETKRIIELGERLKNGLMVAVCDQNTGEIKFEITEKGKKSEERYEETKKKFQRLIEEGKLDERQVHSILNAQINLLENIKYRAFNPNYVIASGSMFASIFRGFLRQKDMSDYKKAWDRFLGFVGSDITEKLSKEELDSMYEDAMHAVNS